MLLFITQLTQCQIQQSGSTTLDGLVSYERAPSYFSLDGTNGIRVPLTNNSYSKQTSELFVRLWFRPNATKTNTSQVIFEIADFLKCMYQPMLSVSCNFTQNSTTNASSLSINLTQDFTYTWLHLALSSQTNYTYLRLDIHDQMIAQSSLSNVIPLPLTFSNASLGIANNNTNGFIGDIREFLISIQYVNHSQVTIIKNQVIQWNLQQLANFRLQKGDLSDMNRPFTSIGSLIGKTNVTWKHDPISVDMCTLPINSANLLKIDSDVMNFTSALLDSRLQPITNFAYTASFWMKTSVGMKTTANSQIARDSLYFFELVEAFSLWFSDPTSIKIFFHATKNVYEQSSKPLYFPQGVWANLQIQIDRLNGYEMRVYDLQRREVARIKESIFLQDQSPTGVFTLVKNFKGYIKQIMLYNTRLSLPVEQTNGQFETIKESTLLIYYKFDRQYFNNNTLLSLASNVINNVNMTGPNILITPQNLSLTYDQVEWDHSFNYTVPSQIGTMNQTVNLFDGISCYKNATTLYRTNDTNASISYNLTLQTSLTQATVELWFKQKISQQTQNGHLFSMYSQSSKQDFMSLYFENNVLKCKPLNDTLLEYTDSIDNNWSHISCSFEVNYDVYGSLYSEGMQKDYRNVLNNQGMIPSGNYTMIIGNRYSYTQGQQSNTYFREVRFWNQARLSQDVQLYRFSQIDLTLNSNLLAYFKLASGASEKIINYISPNTLAVRTPSLIQEFEDNTNMTTILCPQYTFRANNQSQCFRNPFVQHELLIIPKELVNQTKIWYQATVEHSEMVSQEAKYQLFKNKLGIKHNFIIQNQTLSRTAGSSIDLFGNESTSISHSSTNEFRTFFSSSLSVNFNPHQCQYLTPLNPTQNNLYNMTWTQPLLGFQEIHLSSNTTLLSNTTLTLQYKLIDLCNGITNVSSFNASRTEWRVYPKTSQPINIIEDQPFNVIGQVKLTLSDLSQKDASFLIGKFFWNGSNNTYENSQNIVYKIKFVDQMSAPIIQVSDNGQVLIGEDLVMQAGLEYNGMSFIWNCPIEFQEICEQQGTRRFMTVKYSDFLIMTDEKYGEPYKFQLQVFKSTDLDVSLALIPSITQNITWLNIYRPDFQISTESIPVLASQTNVFKIDYSYYNFNDYNLVIHWKIDPVLASNTSSLVSKSIYGNILTIKKGALQYNTTYTLSAAISHKIYSFAMQTVNQTFSTDNPPIKGVTVKVSPNAGIALYTSFQLTFSKQYLAYTLKGFYNATNTSFILLQSSQTPISFKLPQIDQLLIEVRDPISLEYEEIYLKIDILPNTNITFGGIQNRLQNAFYFDDIRRELLIVAYEMQTTKIDAGALKIFIMDYLNQVLNMTRMQYKVMQIIEILSILTASNINNEVSDNAQEQLKTLMTTQTYNQKLTPFVTYILSNLMMYESKQISQMQLNSKNSRILQESQSKLLKLIQLKDDYLNIICTQQVQQGQQTSISTDYFEYIIEKVETSSLIKGRTYFSQKNASNQVILPLRNMTSNIAMGSLCNQVTFFKFDPLKGLGINYNQSVSTRALLVQVTNKWTNYKPNMTNNFTIQLAYNYNQTNNAFKHNQTIIETLPANLANYTGLSWMYDNCQHKYNVNDSLIQTTCQSNNTSNFYALVTDLNRVLIVDFERSLFERLLDGLMNFDSAVIPVLLLLILFNVLMPIIATMKDKAAYQQLSEVYQGNGGQEGDKLLHKISSKIGQPFEQVIYRRDLYIRINNLTSLTSASLMPLFFATLHPMCSIISIFDIEFKRLARFMIISFQMSIIAIICSIVYSKQVSGDLVEEDYAKSIIIGVVLSLLTLPPCQCLINCLKSKLISQSENSIKENLLDAQSNNISKEPADINFEGGDRSPSDISYSHTDNAIIKEADGAGDLVSRYASRFQRNESKTSQQQPSNQDNLEEQTINQQSRVCLKLVLMIFCFVTVLAAILIVALVSAESSSLASKGLTIAFFIAILFGNLILNSLRVLINAAMGPSISQQLSNDQPTSCSLIVSEDALRILEDILLIDEIKSSHQEDPEEASSPQKDQLHFGGTHKRVSVTDRSQVYEDDVDIDQVEINLHSQLSSQGRRTSKKRETKPKQQAEQGAIKSSRSHQKTVKDEPFQANDNETQLRSLNQDDDHVYTEGKQSSTSGHRTQQSDKSHQPFESARKLSHKKRSTVNEKESPYSQKDDRPSSNPSADMTRQSNRRKQRLQRFNNDMEQSEQKASPEFQREEDFQRVSKKSIQRAFEDDYENDIITKSVGATRKKVVRQQTTEQSDDFDNLEIL